MIDAAFCLDHVIQHVAQIHFWPIVFKECAERVLLERVNVFVEFLNVVFTEAFWIYEQLVIVVEASLPSCYEPVTLMEPKLKLCNIDHVWNIIVVLMDVVRVFLVLEWLAFLLSICHDSRYTEDGEDECAELIAQHFV